MGRNKLGTTLTKLAESWKKDKIRLEKIQKKLRDKEAKKEQEEIAKTNKMAEIKRVNSLAIQEFCTKYKYEQTECSVHGILSKTEIEKLVRYAYKLNREIITDSSFYIIDRDRINPFTIPSKIYFKDIERILLLERYLMASPPIYRLEDLRQYLKGDRKNKKIVSVFINDFDECSFSATKMHFTRGVFPYLYITINHLLRDRVLLIAYLDLLKKEPFDKSIHLEWDLNEKKIIYLYNQFITNGIIDKSVRLGLFYQIFNNQLSNFETPIKINSMDLACFLFWSRRKNILLNKQPFKIIDKLKMFITTDGKLITAHNLNRYISEYKNDFLDLTKPVYSKIKDILDKV
jgi:hypothetical protein